MIFNRLFQAALGKMEKQHQRLGVIPKRCANCEESGKIESDNAVGRTDPQLTAAAQYYVPYLKALEREGLLRDVRTMLSV